MINGSPEVRDRCGYACIIDSDAFLKYSILHRATVNNPRSIIRFSIKIKMQVDNADVTSVKFTSVSAFQRRLELVGARTENYG